MAATASTSLEVKVQGVPKKTCTGIEKKGELLRGRGGEGWGASVQISCKTLVLQVGFSSDFCLLQCLKASVSMPA